MLLDELITRTGEWLRLCSSEPDGTRPARKSAAAAAARKRSSRPFRPRLESLEDKLAPAVLTVSTLDDVGAGSLRQAITDANASEEEDDVIQFAPGLQGTVTLGSALPELTGTLAIEGPGASKLSIRPDLVADREFFRVFTVGPDATVTVSGLTLTGGAATSIAGGGIANAGDLTLTDCSVIDTVVPGGGEDAPTQAGAIYNSGTMTITGSNVAKNFGNLNTVGGIFNAGTLTITGSTVIGNRTLGSGITTTGDVPLAGGIHNEGTLTVIASTVVGNSADPGQGGHALGVGILNKEGTATLKDSLVSQNGFDPSSTTGHVPGGDVNGTFVSLGGNLIGDGTGATGFGAATGDRVGTPAVPVDPNPTPPPDDGGSGSTDTPPPVQDDDSPTPTPTTGGTDTPAPDPAQIELANRRRAVVAALYHDLLGRPVDPQGEAHWTAAMQGGVSAQAVAQSILGSQEYRENVVRFVYLSLLKREPDAAGLAAFTAQLARGTSVAQIKAAILGSVEFNQSRSDNAVFLRALYRRVLGRDADGGALAAFGAQLTAGAPRGIVALTVLQSEEARAQFVQGEYLRLLHRPADAGGLTTFVGMLRQGNQDNVTLTLVGSVEYAGLATA